MTNINTRNILLLFILITLLFFIPFTGRVHLFDWDEINFAESAREMIVTGNYLDVQINYQTFWEKPPLFIWLQVMSMKIFGINEFAARFPNALCGFFTLIFLFFAGKRVYNEDFGFLWAVSYAVSVLPFLYFKSGIIDPWFNLFIFSGIHFFILFLINRQYRYLYIILSAFSIGVGILTKGPVALLIFGLTGLVILILSRFKMRINSVQIITYILVLLFVGGFWFLLQVWIGNSDIIIDFFDYQVRLFQTEDAGHGGFLLYHFVVLYIGVFPVSILALDGMFVKYGGSSVQLGYKKWMSSLFWVVLVLFTIVNTKIVHYSSMCYFPLSYFGALCVYKWIFEKYKVKKRIQIQLITLTILYCLVLIALIIIGKNKEHIIASGIIKDRFVTGNLRAEVYWSGFELLVLICLLAGIFMFIYYSRRNNIRYAMVSLYIGVILFTYSTILIFTPKIEKYSQNAAIEFYKSLQGVDCYIETLGFKSYADLFYTNKMPPENRKSLNKQWLLKGKIDKPVYFVTKIHRKEKEMNKYQELEFLYEKNGFVFLVRQPDK